MSEAVSFFTSAAGKTAENILADMEKIKGAEKDDAKESGNIWDFSRLLDQGLIEAADESFGEGEDITETMTQGETSPLFDINDCFVIPNPDEVWSAEGEEAEKEIFSDELEVKDINKALRELLISGTKAAVKNPSEENISEEKELTIQKTVEAEANIRKAEGLEFRRIITGADSISGIMNDFPYGWERLLDDQAGNEMPESRKDLLNRIFSAKTEVENINVNDTLESGMTADSEKNQGYDGTKSDQRMLEFEKPLQQMTQKTNMADMKPDISLSDGMLKNTSSSQPIRYSGATSIFNAMHEVQKQSTIKSFSQDVIKGLQGTEEILHIELDPPELGHVQMSVHRSGEQTHARLFVANTQIGEYFQENLDQIKRIIEAAGMKLGEFTMEVGQHKFREQQENIRQKNSGRKNSFGAGEQNTGVRIAVVNMKENIVSDSKVDLLI